MRNWKSSGRPRLAADRSGNIMLEFALALPIFTLMTVGLLDLGRYSMQKSALLQGARAGAQYGVIAPTEEANINSTAQTATGLAGVTASNAMFCECVSGTTVSCDSATTCSAGVTKKRYVRVNLHKTFSSVITTSTLNFGAFGSWTPPATMSASVTMMVVVTVP
jgi:Flp pilus assembly protein TadG